ncbi:hypothetical protein [Embleya sp. NPDC020630]|uniref:hypothetical protein n=1 Tax=Embleya sp. NPDC020630 TaxID=3363979 RepID=UPI0037BD1372
MNADLVARKLLIEGLDDWLPIDRILDVVRDGAPEAEDFHENVMSILEKLLMEGLMQAGDLGEAGFEAWAGTAESMLPRLHTGLDRFDWAPFGGFCCIANTSQRKSSAHMSAHTLPRCVR